MTAPATDRQLTAAQLAALIALVEAQARARQQLTQTAVNAATAAFRGLTLADWWDAAKVERAIRTALRIVRPSQVGAARITDAYLARAASVMTGRPVAPAGVTDVLKLRRIMPAQVIQALNDGHVRPAYLVLGEHDPDHRRVVPTEHINQAVTMAVPDPVRDARRKAQDPAQAYGRAANTLRFQVVVEGATEQVARQKALVRIAAVAETDVTLAVREQVRKTLGKIPGITGYRRILHPELSDTGPCGLCVVAADRIYKKEDLDPIHDRCKCEVLPIIGSMDPGLRLNSDELAAIYEAAGNTGGDVIKGGKSHSGALKKVRVALAEHGELGPWLVDADQHWRGPREVAKTLSLDRAIRDRARLADLEHRFTSLQRRFLAGEDVERALDWQRNTIERLQRELSSVGG